MTATQTTSAATEKMIQNQSKDLACSIQKTFTTAPKKGKRKPNKKSIQKSVDSIGYSMLFSKDLQDRLNGLFEGEMVHLSFDIKKPLREELNLVAKEERTSICKILNQLAVTYIVAHHTSKHALPNTFSKMTGSPVVIEALNFTQNVQSRPRRLMQNTSPRSEIEDNGSKVAECYYCEIKACEGKNIPAVAFGVFLPTGKGYHLCAVHNEACLGMREWRIK